ncbi:MAG: hypothetical protein VW547_07300 [Alphaproteobacteria bacterium]
MKKSITALAGIAVAAALTGTASAQVVSIATTKGGATAQLAGIISKVVSTKSHMQIRLQVLGEPDQPPGSAAPIRSPDPPPGVDARLRWL